MTSDVITVIPVEEFGLIYCPIYCADTCELMSVHILQLATHDSKYSCKGEVGTVAAGGDDDSRGSGSVVVMRRSS